MENYKEISKATPFQDACKVLNRDPNLLPGTTGLPDDFARDLVARFKIMTIVEAINKLMNFKPDYSGSTKNWFLFYWLKPDTTRPSGFGFVNVFATSIIRLRLSARAFQLEAKLQCIILMKLRVIFI